MAPILILILAISVASVTSSPSRRNADNVKYDQRQEGEFNLRADLENFVILLIPTSPTASTPQNTGIFGAAGGGLSLLDLLSKTIPMKHPKRTKHVKKDVHDLGDPAEQTRHFIQSKTAPYHVDISKSRENLSKLHPMEEVLVASSPSVVLLKDQDVQETQKQPDVIQLQKQVRGLHRVARALVVNVPSEEPKKHDVAKKDVKNFGVVPAKKKYVKEGDVDASGMKLIGAEEQCGPGLERDALGVCRMVKI